MTLTVSKLTGESIIMQQDNDPTLNFIRVKQWKALDLTLI